MIYIFKRLVKDDKGSIMLEFAICGIMFIGFTLGIIVFSLWMYNVSQVKQAARLAANEAAVTGNLAESRRVAEKYLNKMLVACPVKQVSVSGGQSAGYGLVTAEMNPLFPGFQKMIDPRGTSTVNGRIQIRREAAAAGAYRFRQGKGQSFN